MIFRFCQILLFQAWLNNELVAMIRMSTMLSAFQLCTQLPRIVNTRGSVSSEMVMQNYEITNRQLGETPCSKRRILWLHKAILAQVLGSEPNCGWAWESVWWRPERPPSSGNARHVRASAAAEQLLYCKQQSPENYVQRCSTGAQCESSHLLTSGEVQCI